MKTEQMNTIAKDQIAVLTEALEAAGIYVAVEQRDGALILSGEVDSDEMHTAALDLARVIAARAGAPVEDAIEVLDIEVARAFGEDEGIGDASTMTDAGTVDVEQAGEEAVPYFPPTDRVIGEQLADQDEIEVIGGFQPTSLEEEPASEGEPGDDQITQDVLRELREDGYTTDLAIQVETRNGVVVLRGEVAALEEADSAEAVAARVDGVRAVREELRVRGPLAGRHND